MQWSLLVSLHTSNCILKTRGNNRLLLKSKELRSFSGINKIVIYCGAAICFLIGIPQVFPFHTHLEGNKKYPRISGRILEEIRLVLRLKTGSDKIIY